MRLGLACKDALECRDAALVEYRPRVLVEKSERVVVRPSVAVHAWGDECVVHVADGENAGVERETAVGQSDLGNGV